MTTLIPKFDIKNGEATPTGAVNRPINEKLQEIISVKDFGAIGDGTVDDTVAIQNAINSIVDVGGIVFFPQGKYRTTDTLYLDQGTASVQGLILLGSGAGDSDFNNGSSIYFDGTGGNSVAVVKSGDTDFVGNTIQNITIDANNKAGFCVYLNAWGGATHLNKQWSFNKSAFWNATVASVFIGDATLVAGVFTSTPLDSDAHLNVFTECVFYAGTDTTYHAVLNVANNCYQTTFNDCTVEGANASLANFLYQKSASQTVVKNLFAGAIYQPLGTEVSVFWVKEGNIMVNGCSSEEPRIMYREAGARADQFASLEDVVVNQSSNRPDTGLSWKSIVDVNTAPLTLVDCYFFTGTTYVRIVQTASLRLEAANAFVSQDNALGEAPWIWRYPTFAAGWSNKGSGNPVARFRLGNNGYVELGGMVVGGTGTIFTLPAGYRPPKRVDLPVCANYAFGAIVIDVIGTVALNVGSATDVSLENIGFFIY
jgi:hypothetical protein